MKIIKRSGKETGFDASKIIDAVTKANQEVAESDQLSQGQIEAIAERITKVCANMERIYNVEEIQDMVENEIMAYNAFEVARKYITYRYKRALVRKSNSTDQQILSLIECNNEEIKQENSNKNPIVTGVQTCALPIWGSQQGHYKEVPPARACGPCP